MLTTGVFGKISVAGRAGVLAGVAGLLVGGLAVPAVGAVGIMVRNGANKFNNLKAGTIGELPVRSEILDSQGHLMAYYYPRGIDRQPVTYSQIAPVMRNAIVAIEDSRFYQHGAIDIRGTFRALLNDLQHKAVQGGSTLTQQYVKNALILTAPNIQMAQQAATDTISRKIKELRLAIQVEKRMTKNQILAGYLNTAFWGTYFGNQAWGIKTAAMRYFSTSPKRLDLAQAALLAGMVENPVADDPIAHPGTALKRRNVVLARMAQLHYITTAHAVAVGKQGLGLKLTPLQTGCTSGSAKSAAFFCDYVMSLMKQDSTFSAAWKQLNGAGGVKVYTTLNPQDEHAAKLAVNYMVPQPPNGSNPGGNAVSEALVQPGSGRILAIANDRSYGTGKNQTTEDYAVNSQYDGGVGVQTGSSSKLFTLITALEQGVPFGFPQTVQTPASLTGYTNCAGAPDGTYTLVNDSPSEKGAFTLYTATTQSVNVYFAMLERKVGLCNVVKTAMTMGVTRADGRSLTQWDGKTRAARRRPSFVHPGLGQRLADEHGRRLRDRRRPRRVLQTGRRGQDHQPHRDQAAGRVGRLPPGHPGRGGRRGQLHPAGRADLRHRGRPGHRPPGGGQDRHLGQLRLRRIRRLHPRPGRLRVGVQPDRPGQVPDERYRVLLPPRLHGRDVRRGRARTHLADDVPARRAGQPTTRLRHVGHQPRALVDGQRAGQPEPEEEGQRQGPRRGRR